MSSTSTEAPTASPLSYKLQTYITDNLATDYSKVWVTVKKITAVDGAGTEVTLLDASASPVTVNLSSLADVGQFMSTVTLPAGVYAQIKVTLGNAVQLVSLDGSKTISARFNSTGADQVLTLRDLDLNPANTGQLVLDFNLAKFTYDATTGIVTAVVERRDAGEAFGKFIRQQAEVHGSVTAVNTTAGSFTVTDKRLGSVVVTLAAEAAASPPGAKGLVLLPYFSGERTPIHDTKAKGVIFGTCSQCGPGNGNYGQLTMEEILTDHLKPLGVPAWQGAMIGHDQPQWTLPFGQDVEIDATAATVTLLDSAVS